MHYTYKQIWLINFPVMMSILMEQLINITDAVFLGHVGEVELGASAIAGIYYLAVYMLGFGFSIGLQVMIARRNGECDYGKAGKIFFKVSSFIGIGHFALSADAGKFSFHIGKVDFLAGDLSGCNSIFGLAQFRFAVFVSVLVIRSFLVGITCTRALSWAAAVAIVINIPLNYILIIVGGLGISGAAIASSLAEMGSLVMLLFYVWLKIDKGKYGLKPVYDGKLLVDVLSLSVWSMLHAFISVAPWFLFLWRWNIWVKRN